MICGDLKFIFDPKVDNYKGIKTIFTSEEAALVMCEKIFRETKEGEEYFDFDFGPSNPEDIEGSARSMYFDDELPEGYIPVEQISWMRPEEFLDDD